MKTMRPVHKGALILGALLVAGPSEAKHNFGVNSVNQPVVSGSQAIVPNCPNWASGGVDSAAMTDTNYGCAVNSNLAAMVADPADLLHGRSDATTDTASLVRAIKAWREAEPTSKLWMTTIKEAKTGSGQ